MYKIIFTDIDGTLRNSKRELTKRTISAVKKVTKKGILVVLCSGRSQKYTANVSKECGASQYVITSNGANIYDYEKDKDLYTNVMDKKACIELYNIAIKAGVRLVMNVGPVRVVNKLRKMDGLETELKTDIETFVNENNIAQCLIEDTDFEKIKPLKEDIEKVKNVEIKNQHKSLTDPKAPREGTIYYDIANIDSNKGNAVKKLCEILDIDLKDTIAIGDSYNDIPMFEVAGYNVVMGNADEEVKKYADEITLTNDEDGVAVFLEKLI